MPTDRDRRKERHSKYQDDWSPDRRRSFTPDRKKLPSHKTSKRSHGSSSRRSRSRSPRPKDANRRRRSSRDRSLSRDRIRSSPPCEKRKRKSISQDRIEPTTLSGELFPTRLLPGSHIPGLDMSPSPDMTSNAPAVTLDDELLSEDTYLFGKEQTPPPSKKHSLFARYQQHDINVMGIHNKGRKTRTQDAVDDDGSTKEFSAVSVLDIIHNKKNAKKLPKKGIFDRNEITNFVPDAEEPKVVRLIPNKDDLKKLEAKLASKAKSEGSLEKKKSKKKDKDKGKDREHDKEKREHSDRERSDRDHSDKERRRSREPESHRNSSRERGSKDRGDSSPKVISLDKANTKRTAATDPYLVTDDALSRTSSRDVEERKVTVQTRLGSQDDKHRDNGSKNDRDLRRNIDERKSEGGRYYHNKPYEQNHHKYADIDICHAFQGKYGCQRPHCKFVHITSIERQYIHDTGKLPPDMPGYIRAQMTDKLIAKVMKDDFVRIDYDHKNTPIAERLGKKSGVPDFPKRSDISHREDRTRDKDYRPKVRDLRDKVHDVARDSSKSYVKEPEKWSHDKYDELEKEKEDSAKAEAATN